MTNHSTRTTAELVALRNNRQAIIDDILDNGVFITPETARLIIKDLNAINAELDRRNTQ